MENLFLNFKRNSLSFLVIVVSLFVLGSVFVSKAYAQSACQTPACTSPTGSCTTRNATCGWGPPGFCEGQCVCLYKIGCYISGDYCFTSSTITSCNQPTSCCSGGGGNGEPCDGCGNRCKEYQTDDCSGSARTSSCKSGLSCDDSTCHGSGDGDDYSYRACWAGCCGGGSKDDRVVGRVHRDGSPRSGYSITSGGKTASWRSNTGGPYYRIGRWEGGSFVQITLNNPDPGYTCGTWGFTNTPGSPAGSSSGEGCTASVVIGTGGYSPDWQNHLHFDLIPSAAVQGRVRVSPSPYFRPSCASCGSGSCEEMPNLSVTCTIAGEDPVSGSWGCNTGGAYYSTGRAFSSGDTVTCSAQMTSTNYKFTSWYIDNANNDTHGFCINQNSCTTSSVILDEGRYPPPNQGLSDLHFFVELVPRDPWWQVIGGDVAANGSLLSLIPLSTCDPSSVCDSFFDLPPLDGGYPGIPSYIGEADFAEGVGDPGSVSETGWLAESRTVLSRQYGYSYFKGMIPPNVTVYPVESDTIVGGDFVGEVSSGGHLWFEKEEGDLTINGIVNLQNKKVILLVKNGNLNIGDPSGAAVGGIRVNDGSGFFAAIVNGDIIISPKVKVDTSDRQPVLEGIFLAEGEFRTGTTGAKDDGQLWLRGSVAADVINLQRDMTDAVPNNDEYPAELFEYGPDLLLTFPGELTSRRLRWKEVAP